MGEGGREGGDAKNTRETTHAERSKAQTSYAHGKACAYGNRNPLNARPQSEPTNTHKQQTWLATTEMLQKRYRNAGNAKGNTGNAKNATPLPSHARNAAQRITPRTLKLSGERYKQTPNATATLSPRC